MHVLNVGHFELFMKKTTVLQPCGFIMLYDTIPITISILLLLPCIVKSNIKYCQQCAHKVLKTFKMLLNFMCMLLAFFYTFQLEILL